MSLTKTSYSMITGSVINVLDYIDASDVAYILANNTSSQNATNVTTGIQNAINAAQGTVQVFFPAGTYAVNSTLTLFKGSNLIGVNKSQGLWEYSSGFTNTKILFTPATASDLFTVQNLPSPTQSFLGHVSVGGMFIQGDGNGTTAGNARRAFDLNTVIYGNFYDMEIIYFWSGFLCTNTINNKIDNVRISACTTSCVEYAGSAPPTTDVWTQCTFQNAPIGVRFTGGIGIRFISCLIENITSYGAVLDASCQVIEFVSCYGENVPNQTGSTLAMFQVGFSGTDSQTIQLKVVGGLYQGYDTTATGSFLTTSVTSGIQLVGTYVRNFTNFVLTNSSTNINSVQNIGSVYASCTNAFNDATKITGIFPQSAVNAHNPLNARFGSIYSSLGLTTGLLTNPSGDILVTANDMSGYPDNSVSLGTASFRWSVVYAATGTINTSDANQKTIIGSLNTAEQNVAKAIKGLFKTFKFNNAIAKKGENDARIHIGVSAQDVQSAFISQGLDPTKYGIFCSDTWYTVDGKVHDENGVAYTSTSPNAISVTQLGIRYEELLAFVISAI